MNLKMQLVLLFVITLFISSCKKEIEVDPNDNKFPINLKLEEENGLTNLSWDKVNVSTFESYILVRSSEPIPTGLIPKVGDPDHEIIAEITKVDSTVFSDVSAPWSAAVYYKLYVNIGNRFIESQSLVNNQNAFVFDDFFDAIHVDKDSNWTILLSTNSGRIILFDIDENKIISDKQLSSFLDINSILLETGNDGPDRMLYVWDNFSSELTKMSLPDLNIVDQEFMPATCFSIINNGKGQLYLTNYDQTNAFNVRSQSDLKLLKGTSKTNYYEKRVLFLLDPLNQKVVEVSSTKLTSFDVNQTSYVLSNQNSITIPGNTQYIPNEIIYSNDRNYFITSKNGTVYDKDLKLVVKNALDITSKYAFSDDNQFFYQAYTDANFVSKLVKYNFPQMDIVDELELPIFDVKKMVSLQNSILIYGTDPLTGSLLYKRLAL